MCKKSFKHKSFLLLPLEVVLHLFKIKNPLSLLYKYSNSSLDIKTYKSIFSNLNKTQEQTIDKFYNENPGLNANTWFKNLVKGEISDDINLWSALIAPFEDDLEARDFFPISRNKIMDILKTEDEIYKVGKNISSEKEFAELLVSNSFIQKFLSPEITKKLLKPDIEGQFSITLLDILMKSTLYIIAYIDAEFSYDKRERIKDGQSLGKVSIVKDLLPIFEDGKYIPSTAMLFRKWMKNSGKENYAEIYKHLLVSENSYNKADAQKRKFLSWRKGERIAKDKEIIKLLKSIFPEIDAENWKVEIIIIYRVSIFFKEFIDYSLSIKGANGGLDLFKSDREAVEWLEKHYMIYYDQAYSEIEKISKKD